MKWRRNWEWKKIRTKVYLCVGYDHVEYYYIPDIQAYYYVPDHQFIYLNRGHWTFSRELPPRY